MVPSVSPINKHGPNLLYSTPLSAPVSGILTLFHSSTGRVMSTIWFYPLPPQFMIIKPGLLAWMSFKKVWFLFPPDSLVCADTVYLHGEIQNVCIVPIVQLFLHCCVSILLLSLFLLFYPYFRNKTKPIQVVLLNEGKKGKPFFAFKCFFFLPDKNA